MTSRPVRFIALLALAIATPALAQHHPTAASSPPPPAIATAPGATFSLRLDRGRGPEYPRTDYSRATVRVVPVLDRNRPAYQLYGRARFYTLDGEFHDLSCSFTVYADGSAVATRDYPCRDRSPLIDLANVDGVQVTTLSETRVEFRIAIATMISTHHVYRDIAFRLEAPGGDLLTPSREYRPD